MLWVTSDPGLLLPNDFGHRVQLNAHLPALISQDSDKTGAAQRQARSPLSAALRSGWVAHLSYMVLPSQSPPLLVPAPLVSERPCFIVIL